MWQLILKVFLWNLFFSSSILLSNSLIVSNCLLIFSLFSFILNFELCLTTVVTSIKFDIFCFLFYLFHLDVYLSDSGVKFLLYWNKFLTEIIKFSLSSALISSKLLLALLLELLSFPFPGITNLNWLYIYMNKYFFWYLVSDNFARFIELFVWLMRCLWICLQFEAASCDMSRRLSLLKDKKDLSQSFHLWDTLPLNEKVLRRF